MKYNYFPIPIEDFDYDNLSADEISYFVEGFGLLDIVSTTDCEIILRYDNCCNDEELRLDPNKTVKYVSSSLTDRLKESLISGEAAFPMELGAALAAKYEAWKEKNGKDL